MNSLPNIIRHILKPNPSHLDLVWMPSSRGDQPCTYPFRLRAAPRSFLIFFLFSHFFYIFCTCFFFHIFILFLNIFFVCRQMFPQMKFRLTGLDPKVSQSIASGIFSPLVAGQVFCPVFICRTCFLPHFLIAGQVHSPTRHCCLWRLSLQVPQQVSLICRVSQKKVDNGILMLGCQKFRPLWTIEVILDHFGYFACGIWSPI